MKILLVRYHDRGNINTRLPDSLNKRQGHLPPLGIAYLAAVLKKNGHEVKILDCPAQSLAVWDIKKIIEEYRPHVAGITVMTTNFKGALECAEIVKNTKAITVLGGPQMDVLPEEMLSYDFVDYGFSGESERSFPKFCKVIETGSLSGLAKIHGLIYREGGKIRINPPEIIEDIDSLPFPARELLPNHRYSSIIGKNPVTTMITTRGCPYRCGFCFKGPQDKRFRMRSPESVSEEMAQVVRDFGVREIMFYDDVMTANRRHVEGICEEILKKNIQVCWESPTRIDIVDRDLLKLMKKAGCIRLRYGVESGDPETLERMNKNISLEKVREVFRMTEEEGIERFAYFIIGYAGENDGSMRKTIDFAKELSPDLVMFTLATPLPCTPLFDEAVMLGLVDKDYWKDWTLGKRTDRIPALVPGAEEYVKKAYREFYLRPGYVIKKLSGLRNLDMVRRYYDAFLGIVKFRM